MTISASRKAPGLTERRAFLAKCVLTLASLAFAPLSDQSMLAATTHRYNLASESILPTDIRRAALEVREAYRFAIANRDTLRYIPCYCGCGAQGHTSNASCYIQDSTPKQLVFDRMSLG